MSRPARDRSEWRSLRTKSEFSRVYEAGVKRVGRLFVLYLYPGEDLARAVVASRKVGGAVQRNRAKRLLREALASRIQRTEDAVPGLRSRFLPDAPAGQGLWVVAVARVAIAGKRIHDVAEELDRLLAAPRSGDDAAA